MAALGSVEAPDPIQLGEELAEYIQKRRKTCGIALEYNKEDTAILNLLELHWERDFWRGKCLGE